MDTKGKKKVEWLQIRMTRQDKLQLQGKAKESGKNMSDYIRDNMAKL